MDRYNSEQNLALYRKRLAETLDDEQRRVLRRLIADELAKEWPPKAAGDEDE